VKEGLISKLSEKRTVVDVCYERDVLTNALEEFKTGLRITEAHIVQGNKPPEQRAELRGRELAYRTIVQQLQVAIRKLDRLGAGTDIEGAIANIEAAERLVSEVKTAGYKSQYSLGVCKDSLLASRRALIGLWNVTSEEK